MTAPPILLVRQHVSGEVKPYLRGWLHAAALPMSGAAGTFLIVRAPTGTGRAAAWGYAVCSWLLFSVSAAYHLGRWRPPTRLLLQRLDHASIYVIIAGTYTPLVLLGGRGGSTVFLLAVVWASAAVAVAFRVLRPAGPRSLDVASYVLVGCLPAVLRPTLLLQVDPAVAALTLAGAGLYGFGALVYGLQRPDPFPDWFGFHELFHALTLLAYGVQYVAICLLTFRS